MGYEYTNHHIYLKVKLSSCFSGSWVFIAEGSWSLQESGDKILLFMDLKEFSTL